MLWIESGSQLTGRGSSSRDENDASVDRLVHQPRSRPGRDRCALPAGSATRGEEDCMEAARSRRRGGSISAASRITLPAQSSPERKAAQSQVVRGAQTPSITAKALPTAHCQRKRPSPGRSREGPELPVREPRRRKRKACHARSALRANPGRKEPKSRREACGMCRDALIRKSLPHRWREEESRSCRSCCTVSCSHEEGSVSQEKLAVLEEVLEDPSGRECCTAATLHPGCERRSKTDR